jgi:hypothetical protein
MKIINSYAAGPLDATSTGLHINPLKFLGCIVNMWILVKSGSDTSLVSDWLHRRPVVGQHLCALVDEIDCYHWRSSSSTSGSFCLNVIGHREPTSNPPSASSYPRKGQRQSGLLQLLQEWVNTYVGLR